MIARRLACAVLAVIALSACKQGIKQRCQVQADCDDGLVCVASGICVGPVDAAPIMDAPSDAPPDAPPDAP